MYGSSQFGRDNPSLELFVLDDGYLWNVVARCWIGSLYCMYIEFVGGHGQWAFADDDRQQEKRREDGETGVVIWIGNGKQMEESGR